MKKKEIKEEKVEKKEITTEETKPKKSKGKVVVIVMAILAIIYLICLKGITDELNARNSEPPRSNSGIKTLKWKIIDGFSLNPYALFFSCTRTNETATEEFDIGKNGGNEIYGIDDYLSCKMEINSPSINKLDYMSFDFESESIELVNVTSTSSVWTVEKGENNNVTITAKELTDKEKIKSLNLLLHIKNTENNTEKFHCELKNIDIHNDDYKEDVYNHIQDKEVEFKTGNKRYYHTDNLITFEKKQSNGTFKKTNEYQCSGKDCYVNMASQVFGYNNSENENIVMIKDEELKQNVLFDIEKGIIGRYGNEARWLYSETHNTYEGKYIYINDKDSNKYEIIDKDGNLIHAPNLEDIKAFTKSGILETVYSIENDMILDQRNGKYGIVKMTSNDTIIDYSFDSIRLLVTEKYISGNEATENHYEKTVNSKYFKGMVDGKWYLYSFETKEKAINEDYDNIFIANNDIIITEKDKYLSIKDYSGNNLVEDKIEDLSKEYIEYVCCANNPGIEITEKDGIITIKTYKNNEWGSYNQYEYNISNKKLTKIK